MMNIPGDAWGVFIFIFSNCFRDSMDVHFGTDPRT